MNKSEENLVIWKRYQAKKCMKKLGHREWSRDSSLTTTAFGHTRPLGPLIIFTP